MTAAVVQTVNWADPTPEMRRVNRQIVWHARKGRLWVLALLAALLPFAGGAHVRYGKEMMLTLPAGPVQQALEARYGRK